MLLERTAGLAPTRASPDLAAALDVLTDMSGWVVDVHTDVARGARRSNPSQPDRLTPETERRLVANAAARDRRACEALVEHYLPAISGVARLYRHARVEHVDLMQEGVVGLLRAVRRFDPELRVPFWAYASWWVRQAMQQLTSDLTRSAALSDRAMRALAAVKRAQRQLAQANGHEPTIAELVPATGFTRGQIDALLAIDRSPRALQEPVGDATGGATWGDSLIDPLAEDEYQKAIEHMEVARVRPLVDGTVLDQREREILYDRYGLDRPAKTLRTIAAQLGISAERVRQIEEGALTKLRTAATGRAEVPTLRAVRG